MREPHIVVPKGMVALRLRAGSSDVHHDLVVSQAVADILTREHGAELLSNEGLVTDDPQRLFERLDRECREAFERGDVIVIDSVTDTGLPDPKGLIDQVAELEQHLIPVPHLKRFEYHDRPLLDLGPVPRPRYEPPPGARSRRDPSDAATSRKRNRNRRRNKAARKSRRKNNRRGR